MNGILEIAVRPSILFISIKDRNAMTETTWTNCADEKPPNDNKLYLMLTNNRCVKLSGKKINVLCSARGPSNRKWKDLSK